MGEANTLTASTFAAARERAAGLVWALGLEPDELHAEVAGGTREPGARRNRAWVGQRRNPPRLWDVLMQDFQSLYVQLRGKNAHSGRIAAGSRQAGRKPTADHVIGHADDRNGLGRALHRSNGGVAERNNEVDLLCDELASELRRTITAALRPDE
jgi:hypothetical protein